MKTEDCLLPPKFSDLEPFVNEWSLLTQNEREKKRRQSRTADLKLFYETVVKFLEEAIQYLNAYALDDLPLPEKRLFGLMLMLAEVAPHMELYGGKPGVPFAFEETRFIAEHGESFL